MKYKIECIYHDKITYDKDIQAVATFKDLKDGIRFFMKQENYGSKGDIKQVNVDVIS